MSRVTNIYTAQSQLCQVDAPSTHNLFIKSFVTALCRLKLRHLQAVRHPIPNAFDGWINHAIVALSIYTRTIVHTPMNNQQCSISIKCSIAQNAVCKLHEVGGEFHFTGHYSYAMSALGVSDVFYRAT